MKRGEPLKRTVPLVAKTGLRRTTKLQQQGGRESLDARKSAPRKVRIQLGPTAEVVAAVTDRERHSCLVCGRGIGPDERGRYWSLHHRLRRSQGADHSPQNLILVCGGSEHDGCHQRIHREPENARAGGWLLRGRQHPLAIPVLIPLENRLVYLTSTGLYHDVRSAVSDAS